MEYNIIACEGKTEMYLVQHLVERGLFFLSCDTMFDNRPLHIRQLTDIKNQINAMPLDTEINVYRIGDTQKDQYNLDPFELRKQHIHISTICTKPEIEILIIIAEGKINDYKKTKLTPKKYIKQYLSMYSDFVSYLNTHDIVPAIKEYKKIKKHSLKELYLADYLN